MVSLIGRWPTGIRRFVLQKDGLWTSDVTTKPQMVKKSRTFSGSNKDKQELMGRWKVTSHSSHNVWVTPATAKPALWQSEKWYRVTLLCTSWGFLPRAMLETLLESLESIWLFQVRLSHHNNINTSSFAYSCSWSNTAVVFFQNHVFRSLWWNQVAPNLSGCHVSPSVTWLVSWPTPGTWITWRSLLMDRPLIYKP